VGKVEVFSAFGANSVRILVHTGTRHPTYRTAPGCLIIHLHQRAVGWLCSKLRDNHVEAIRIGGRTRTGEPRHYGAETAAHSPGLLRYIGLELGRPIPSPRWTLEEAPRLRRPEPSAAIRRPEAP
jgi:hypothetical protein